MKKFNKKSEDFHAKYENYKENIFYHIKTDLELSSDIGEGLYLGKDKNALIKFYGSNLLEYYKRFNIKFKESVITIQTFYGNPKFLDLTNENDFNVFKEYSLKQFPNEDNSNELRKMTLELKYDGIRYYDPIATGEEFVLYNTNKVKLIETISIK